ncbi:hypothetical protein ACU70A_09340 [Syntrophomonas erecta subsp. sporosyntropha]
MQVLKKHFSIGLIYKEVGRLFPALAGTLVSLFYQFINLYGLIPAALLMLFILGMITGLAALSLQLISLFNLSIVQSTWLACIGGVFSFLAWITINININRQAGLQIIKINYSSRTAFILLSLILSNQILPIRVEPGTQFWDLHFKPHLAGNLGTLRSDQLTAAIQADYLRLREILPANTILFGCTPGSLEKRLRAAGVKPSDFTMVKTIIPPEHAKIFGPRRSFFLYVFRLS